MSLLLDALGFVGDTLDRPGAAVRGLLAGRPDQLAYLVPGAESMGLVDPSRRLSGRGLLREYGLAGDEDNWGNWAGGFATDVLTNPLNWPGMAAAGKWALNSLRPSSKVADMMKLRRGFDTVEVDPFAENPIVRPSHPFPRHEAAADRFFTAALDAADDGSELMAIYSPGADSMVVPVGTAPASVRHEAVHGLIDQARKMKTTAGLSLPQKAAMWADPTGTTEGFRGGLGLMLEETAAHAAEGRGLLDQLRGAGNFLFERNPFRPSPSRQAYAQQIGGYSPLAEGLYRGLGVAPHGLAAGALGAAGIKGYDWWNNR